jgi:polyhydroxybutyrate depolymerase
VSARAASSGHRPGSSAPAATALAVTALALCGYGAPLTAAIQPDECLSARRADAAGHEAGCYSVTHGGMKRTLRVYVPSGRREPLPVLVVLHGGGGTGGGMEWLTRRGFNRIADRDGAIVLYPDGIDHGWNDGRSTLKRASANVDDLGFLRALPRELSALHPIDAASVYVTGISNGGMMSYRLACDAAEMYAAAAPVAANMSVELSSVCHPARPVPLLVMNGTEDPIMPWKGGVVRVLWMARGSVLSSDDTLARWLALDHCAQPEPGAVLNADPDDGTTVVPRTAQCAGGAQVSLYEIRGGGHTWPKGAPYLSARLVGRVSQALDANETIWKFFRQHPRS